MLIILLLLGSAAALVLVSAKPGFDPHNMNSLDMGFQFSFANIRMRNGDLFKGQIVGVYNEKKFMWHPTEFSTIAVFTSIDPIMQWNMLSTVAGDMGSIFTLSSKDISSIEVIEKPIELVEYREYMRLHEYTLKQVPLDGDAYVLEAWTTYHTWEDGRSNYAWDLAKLNSNMMTYTYPGDKLTDFAVFGEQVYLPMNGKVITAVKKEIDNPPDLSAAVDLMDHDSGDGIDLQEKPQNMIEVEIGGEDSSAMLRLLHLQQDSIPDTIQVGKHYPAGTLLGLAGNSGTTYTPHLHLVFGFWDNRSRFWSLPIEFESVKHRILLPYPSGYEYSNYHEHEFLYPKLGYCIKSV